jgi:glutamate racemase
MHYQTTRDPSMNRAILKNPALFTGLMFFLACAGSHRGSQQAIHGDIRDVMLTQPNSFFYVDTSAYPRHNRQLPIGMFDSGTGGLTVLDAIVNFDGFDNGSHAPDSDGDGCADFQSEQFIYLGDQANMPYGDYAQENNLPLLREHIFKDLQFLLGRKYYSSPQSLKPEEDKKPVKAIVIACNTATAYGKKEIEQFIGRARLGLKVIGVIDAGVRGALEYFAKTESGTIAVMATPGTVSSNGYPNSLADQMAALGCSGQIALFSQPGHGLAGAIDGEIAYIAPQADAPRAEYRGPSLVHPHAVIDSTILPRYGFGWDERRMLYEGAREEPRSLQINSIENYIAYNLLSLLEQLRQAQSRHPLKVLILGCTHYPFYLDVFKAGLDRLHDYQENGEYIYRPFMADTIHLVDPARNTARELYEYLKTEGLFSASDPAGSEFYISVPNRDNPAAALDAAGNFTWAYKYGRRAGAIQEYIKNVPFSKETIPAETSARLKRAIPKTSELIGRFMLGNEIIKR